MNNNTAVTRRKEYVEYNSCFNASVRVSSLLSVCLLFLSARMHARTTILALVCIKEENEATKALA